MPTQIHRFENIATHGIIRDALPTELPQTVEEFAWSDGQNVRFHDGKAQKTKGESEFLAVSAAPSMLVPMNYAGTDQQQWAYAFEGGGLRVFDQFGRTLECTVSSFLASTAGDVAVEPLGTSRLVAAFRSGGPWVVEWSTNLTSYLLQYNTASTWVGSSVGNPHLVRQFGNYLVALGENGVAGGDNKVSWSTTVDGNTRIPGTWDPATDGELAGSTHIDEGYGYLVDFRTVRDTGYLYKQRATWGMQETGTNDVFRFFEVFSDLGAIDVDCIGVLEDEHVVFGHDDIYIHNGVNYRRLLSKRVRKDVFENINRTATGRIANVAVNKARGEVWLAYASGSSNNPDKVIIYDYENDTVGDRVLSATTRHMAYGRVFATAMSGASTIRPRWRIATATENGLRVSDETFTLNGTVMESYVERKGLTFGNESLTKLITRVWPRLTTSNSSVNVRVGTHNTPTGAVTWSDQKAYTPGIGDSLSFDVKGRYLAIRFETTADINWSLTGFDMQVRLRGHY